MKQTKEPVKDEKKSKKAKKSKETVYPVRRDKAAPNFSVLVHEPKPKKAKHSKRAAEAELVEEPNSKKSKKSKKSLKTNSEPNVPKKAIDAVQESATIEESFKDFFAGD